jgi:signal transduction histidine kinase
VKSLLRFNLDSKIVLVALLYYLSARLGYFLLFDDSNFLTAWPPSGVGFAMVLIFGRSTWPGITIGALLSNILAYWTVAEVDTNHLIFISLMVAAGSTAEALLGNYLIKKWIDGKDLFLRTTNTFRFLFVTMLMATLGAGIGTGALAANGIVPAHALGLHLISWWVGNVVGILLFTPLILSFRRVFTYAFTTQRIIEILVFMLLITGLVLLLQVGELNQTLQKAFPLLCFPFLLWLAFRFNLTISMAAALTASLVAIHATTRGMGPFVLADSYNSMFLLQIFIGVISISTLILSATVKERNITQQKLEAFNETLEGKVQERTKKLKEEVQTRKKAEETLQTTNEQLRKTNTELDNFVYRVSHDLRAPIASVLGLINLAKMDHEIQMKDQYLDMIHKSALQQDHFIRDILDQSRNSRLELLKEEVYFEPLIAETINQLKFINPNQPLQTDVIVSQSEPFVCDSWRLKVILNNLISNSIRYRNGKDPFIRVSVEVEGETAKVHVEDNGKGIGPDHLEHVFKMFYRATDDNAGSGLGLYIVKEAIDKLQGKIHIESEEGKGTKVSLEIPEVG